jgi:hypothetical protein
MMIQMVGSFYVGSRFNIFDSPSLIGILLRQKRASKYSRQRLESYVRHVIMSRLRECFRGIKAYSRTVIGFKNEHLKRKA